MKHQKLQCFKGHQLMWGFPNKDKYAELFKKYFPKKVAHKLIRFKNIFVQILFFQACKIWPNYMKKLLVKAAQKKLGDFQLSPILSQIITLYGSKVLCCARWRFI